MNEENKIILLPNTFKKVGIIIIVLTAIIFFILVFIDTNFNQEQKNIYRMIFNNLWIISLCFIAFSKDKIEDERSISIRLRTFNGAFLFGVLMFIISPIMDIIFNDPISYVSGQYIIGVILLFYIFTYNYTMRKERKEINNEERN